MFTVFRSSIEEVIRLITTGQLVVPANPSTAVVTGEVPGVASLPVQQEKKTTIKESDSHNSCGEKSHSSAHSEAISSSTVVNQYPFGRSNRFLASKAYINSALELLKKAPSSEKQAYAESRLELADDEIIPKHLINFQERNFASDESTNMKIHTAPSPAVDEYPINSDVNPRSKVETASNPGEYRAISFVKSSRSNS